METESALFNGRSFSGDFEAGYEFRMRGLLVKPYAALNIRELWEDGFNEISKTSTGGPGSFGLAFAAQQTDSVQSQLGARFEGRVNLGGGSMLLPYLKAGWAHEFDPKRQVSTGFLAAPGYTFVNAGAEEFHDAAKFDAGGLYTLKSGLGLYARVSTTLSDRDTAVEGDAGLSFHW